MLNNKMPNDEDAERFILGSILTDEYSQYQVMQELEVRDFYSFQHQKIFECFESIHKSGRRVDVFNSSMWLKEDGTLVSIGGAAFIDLIAQNYANTDADYYIQIVKELHGKRTLIQIGEVMSSKAISSKDNIDDLIGEFQISLSEIGGFSRKKFTNLKDVIENYKDGKHFMDVLRDEVERVKNGEDIFSGVRTYFEKLDGLIGGFENGTNNIIGARSSSGKTTFLTNLFLNISKNNPEKRIGFFSLEMSKERILDKLACSLAGVSYKKFQERDITLEELDRYHEAIIILSKMNLTLFDFPGISINELKTYVRRESIKNKLDIVFLDYLTLVQSSKNSSNKHQEVDTVSKGLQSIALELNIPFVTLSQLNRNIYGRPDKTPVLADLRESGSIEEDADLVMLLHRPIHFKTQKEIVNETVDGKINDNTQLIVAKSRLRGDLGKVEFSFLDGKYFEIKNIEKLLPNQVVNSNQKEEPWRSSTHY